MSKDREASFLVMGGAHLDRVGRSTARLEPGQSNPGNLNRTMGGVAANIGRALARLEWQVAISSIIGKDADGDLVLSYLSNQKVDGTMICRAEKRTTASYTAIEDRDGALIAAIADMSIYDHYPLDQLHACLAQTTPNTTILADTNLPEDVLEQLANEKGTHMLAVCAVSGPKANRAKACLHQLDLLFCNEAEAAILADEYADLAALPAILQEEGVKAGIITKGDQGLTAWQGDKVWQLPAAPIKVKSSNGAGDCLAACILHGLALTGSLEEALPYGMAGASLALMSNQTVPDLLTRQTLQACIAEIPKPA